LSGPGRGGERAAHAGPIAHIISRKICKPVEPETAINGEADTIVTFNVRHLAQAARYFGIAVERPADLLRRLP
jgi:hypothetical protein